MPRSPRRLTKDRIERALSTVKKAIEMAYQTDGIHAAVVLDLTVARARIQEAHNKMTRGAAV
jgi:formate dehydrogenase assembly factor FdhD